MAKWRVICGDVTTWKNDGLPFHACLSDVPYHLGDKGFMGKDWDAAEYGVSFSKATWENIASWLHPGAFLFIMAGMLNDDLISVAMREAGLVKHHRGALYWQQGQSFPKSTRIDTQIDKAAGAEREVVGVGSKKPRMYTREYQAITGYRPDGEPFEHDKQTLETAPATPLAKIWEGHRYGTQSLKSSAEAVLCYQRSLTDCSEYDKLVSEITSYLEVILCQFINVTVAEKVLSASNQQRSVQKDTIAHSNASLIHRVLSRLQDFEVMGISPWLVEASIPLSIVLLWSSILDASSERMSTSTTSTETEVITGLKILSSYLAQTIRDCIAAGEMNQTGLLAFVGGAEKNLSASKQKLQSIQTPIAQKSVTEQWRETNQGECANGVEKNLTTQAEQESIVTASASTCHNASREALTQLALSVEKFITNLAQTLQMEAKTFATNASGSVGESLLIFRREYSGRPVDSITETGAGALNIELGRIGNETRKTWMCGSENYKVSKPVEWKGTEREVTGRWPSSTLFLHSPVCRRLDGVRSVRGKKAGEPFKATNNVYGKWNSFYNSARHADANGNESIPRYACAQHCDNCGASWAAEQLEPCVHCGTGEWVDCPKCNGSGYKIKKGWWCPVCKCDNKAPICPVCNDVCEHKDIRQDCQACVGSGCVASGAATVWDCVCRVLDGQSGIVTSGAVTRSETATASFGNNGIYGKANGKIDGAHFPSSSGGANRFYFQADYTYERIEQAAPFFYSAKASKAEKNAGLDDFYWCKADGDFERVMYEEWLELPEKQRAQGNIHPTQKPISLCIYLASLLALPPEYAPRRLVIPFAGKGSEGVGALLSGQWEEIVLIEQSQKYCDAASARLTWWEAAMQEYQSADPKEILKRAAKSKRRKHKSAQPTLL